MLFKCCRAALTCTVAGVVTTLLVTCYISIVVWRGYQSAPIQFWSYEESRQYWWNTVSQRTNAQSDYPTYSFQRSLGGWWRGWAGNEWPGFDEHLCVDRFGWPFLAAETVQVYRSRQGVWEVSRGQRLSTLESGEQRRVTGAPFGALIPTRVLLGGFILNVVVYTCVSAVLWVVALGSIQRARRWLRSRRHQCVHCGYPMLPSRSVVCPECGWSNLPKEGPPPSGPASACSVSTQTSVASASSRTASPSPSEPASESPESGQSG